MGSPAVSPSHDPLLPRPRLRPRHQRARMRSRSACRCLSSRRVRRRHRRALKTPPSVVRRPRLRLLVMSSRRAPTPFSTIWTTKAVSLVAPSTPSRTPALSSVYGTIIITTTTLRKVRRPTEGLLWRIVGRLIHYLSSSHAPHPVPSTRCRTPPHHHLRVIPTVSFIRLVLPLLACTFASFVLDRVVAFGPCSSSAASSSSGHRMILMSISVHNCLASQFASYIPPCF